MKRVLSGLFLFLCADASIAAGGIWVGLALSIACVLAGNEYLTMVQAKGIRPSPRITRFMIVAFHMMACVPVLFNQPWGFGLEHFPLLLLIGICMSFFRLLFRNETPPATIADIATTIMGFIYLGFLPSHMVLLRNLEQPGTVMPTVSYFQPGVAYLIATLFTILATDVFAYIVGKRFGKTLLYPQVSPKKTVEGAIGAFVASVICATICVWAFDTYFPGLPFHGNLIQAPFMGGIISIACQLGDLAESLLKRDAKMKDSSTLIPGHGGMLDRGDAMIFGGAIGYYWIRMVVLGIL